MRHAPRVVMLLLALVIGLIQTPSAAAQQPIWVNHNAFGPLPGRATEEQLRFLPTFIFTKGTCLPAPVFDAEGRLGSGLKASGKIDGNCLAFDQANIYTQTLPIGDYRVHAYALYYPKDGSVPNGAGGHRHDWEHVLIWTLHDEISQVTFSQHAGWYTLAADKIKTDGTHARVYVGKAKHGMYHGRNNGPGGFMEGICYFCDTRSDPGLPWYAPHRLLAFEELSPYQRQLLQSSLWDKANSPFRVSGFRAHAQSILNGEWCRDRGCQCDADTGSCPGFP